MVSILAHPARGGRRVSCGGLQLLGWLHIHRLRRDFHPFWVLPTNVLSLDQLHILGLKFRGTGAHVSRFVRYMSYE